MEEKVSYQRKEVGGMDPVYGPVVVWGGGFLAWYLCGVIAYKIGRHKNRPVLSFALIPVFMGPLALFVALVVPRRALPAPALAQCPYCRFIIPIDAQVCGHCRGRLALPPEMLDVTPR
jgi:hypothetical protein